MSVELGAMLREAADAIDDTELERLREEYPDWRIWRSRGRGASWYASKRAGAPEESAPTLAANSLLGLEKQLQAPPQRAGRPLSALGAHP